MDFIPINQNSTQKQLFPFPISNKSAYFYRGSTTSPPCSENVNWLIQTEPVQLNKQHIADLKASINSGKPNNRQQFRLGNR